MLSHDDHEVVEGNATQVTGQPAAAGCAPAHLHQLPSGELSQDLIGKLHGDQLRFRHLGGGVLLSVQQHPQHPQRIVRFPCDEHIPASPFLLYTHSINLDKSCQDIFGGIIPSFCHIPKKRTALPCKILVETASAWRTIAHEKDHAR